MRKHVDFERETARARHMSDAALEYAIKDAWETFRLWEKELPENDPDGNRGFYEDQHSVYVQERDRRKRKGTWRPLYL